MSSRRSFSPWIRSSVWSWRASITLWRMVCSWRLHLSRLAFFFSLTSCLRKAGIPMHKAMGSKTAVFASGFNHDHLSLLNSDPESTIKYKPTSVTNSIISNRVSWFFDFKAPSVTIDTACSSSMVSLHLAAQSLHSGESDMVSYCESPVPFFFCISKTRSR